MNKKPLFSILAVVILASVHLVEAQQPKKVPRIGFLSFMGGRNSPVPRRPLMSISNIEAFRLGLRDLGYFEGQNIVIEYRFAEGKRDRLPELAAELVRLKVEVIVAGDSVATPFAAQATRSIPIVMTVSGDPVGAGYIAVWPDRAVILQDSAMFQWI
jgi:putative ABC transport system substrate-binding protein